MTEVVRPTLGSYMSVECFRYLRFGAEEAAGRALIVHAGKLRGHSLADVLQGLGTEDIAAISAKLGSVLGEEGTRLCLVQGIARTADGYAVTITESACASGLKADEPVCAYTLGVFIGALETISGKRIHGRERECAAVGFDHCLYEMEVL